MPYFDIRMELPVEVRGSQTAFKQPIHPPKVRRRNRRQRYWWLKGDGGSGNIRHTYALWRIKAGMCIGSRPASGIRKYREKVRFSLSVMKTVSRGIITKRAPISEGYVPASVRPAHDFTSRRSGYQRFIKHSKYLTHSVGFAVIRKH